MTSNDIPPRLQVGPDEDGSRLDRFLIRHAGEVKRPLILRLIRKGNVRVNGKRSSHDLRLKQGDEIFLPASLREKEQATSLPVRLPLIPVIYEDEVVLVINKPTGVVVHGGSGYEGGLIEGLREQMQLPELRLAHRIDRDTSGCLLLAKRLDVLRQFTEGFRQRDMDKTYLAWVVGHSFPAAACMESNLSKGVLRGGERMVTDDDDGKPARTHYQVILYARWFNLNCALLALTPESGRTHQLRVQLSEEGHPILGDTKYGDDESRQHFRKHGGRRLMLHAWRLRYYHPLLRREMEVRAPWPDEWSRCFNGYEPVTEGVI